MVVAAASYDASPLHLRERRRQVRSDVPHLPPIPVGLDAKPVQVRPASRLVALARHVARSNGIWLSVPSELFALLDARPYARPHFSIIQRWRPLLVRLRLRTPARKTHKELATTTRAALHIAPEAVVFSGLRAAIVALCQRPGQLLYVQHDHFLRQLITANPGLTPLQLARGCSSASAGKRKREKHVSLKMILDVS